MKKTMFWIFLLLVFEIFGMNTIISGGSSLNREVQMDVYVNGVLTLETSVDAVNSYDFGIESFLSPSNIFHLGIGFRYEPELHEVDDEGIANIMPLYFIGKLLIPIGSTYLTTQINVGYSLILPLSSAESKGFTDLTGGLYYGVGLGYEFGSIVIAGNYNVSSLDARFLGIADLKATAQKVNITLGYKFGQ